MTARTEATANQADADRSYRAYVATARAMLANQPKGAAFMHEGGAVLLLWGELHYVEQRDTLDDAVQGDPSAWDDGLAAIEWERLERRELIQRFTPAEVEAFEAANG